MAFLTAVIGVQNADGSRADTPDAFGNYPPIVLKLGTNLSASLAQSGGLSVLTLDAAGGGAVSWTAIATAGMSATSPLPLNDQRLTSVGEPVDDSDGARYVDVVNAQAAALADAQAYTDAHVHGLTTAADVDFTALTPQAFADGTVTIDGKAWTVADTAGSSIYGVTAAGLSCLPERDYASPRISIPLATLAPAASLARHEVWILARLRLSAGTPTASSTYLRMALGYGTADVETARQVYTQHGWASGTVYNQHGCLGGFDSGSVYTRPATSHEDIVVAWQFCAGARSVRAYQAAYSLAWPSIDSMKQLLSRELTFNNEEWTPSSALLHFWWSDTGSSDAVMSVPRIQVLYR